MQLQRNYQVFQEETEFQQGIDDVRGRRRAAGAAGASQQPSQAAMLAQQEQRAATQLKDAAMLYAAACSTCSRLLRQLWLSNIPSTGILEPQPHRALRSRMALSTAAEPNQQVQEGGDGEEDASDGEGEQQPPPPQQQQRGARALSAMRAAQLVEPHNMKRLLWKLLHPQATLQLCFLGCVLLREAVTLYDLLGWALDGQLPFLELPHLSMQVAAGDALSVLPVRCLQPQLQLGPLAFCSGCCQLSSQLGLTLPQLPGQALLMRAVKELGLPQVVYETALQLYCLHLLGSQRMHLAPLQRRSQALPYTWLSAVLLVSVKLLYGLGLAAAGQVPLLPKAPGPPDGWLGWAQHALQQLPGVSSLPLSEQEPAATQPPSLFVAGRGASSSAAAPGISELRCAEQLRHIF
ncbi:hypothetical protein COO60DRAFT_1657430 [Scenedesmus sp. NREL 46B-D3]|nr:hypothetical protein COO60DRAFT_1657430 [Scenedesmus sp. NREL 46B-D3]